MSDWKDELAPDQDLPVAYLLKTSGDYVVGEIVHHTYGYDTEYRDGTYPIVVLRFMEGEQQGKYGEQKPVAVGDLCSVHVFSKVLEKQLAAADPQEGETCGIVRRANRKVKGKKDREYATYAVRVKGRKRATGFMAAQAARKRADLVERQQAAEARTEQVDIEDEGLPF